MCVRARVCRRLETLSRAPRSARLQMRLARAAYPQAKRAIVIAVRGLMGELPLDPAVERTLIPLHPQQPPPGAVGLRRFAPAPGFRKAPGVHQGPHQDVQVVVLIALRKSLAAQLDR